MYQKLAGIQIGKNYSKKMKTKLSSFDIVQNVAISSISLHTFTLAYCSVAKNKSNKDNLPKLQYYFYILPLIYHEESLNYFYNRNNLYTVLSKYPEITTQLNHRANKMSKQTLDALNLAFNKKLLTIKRDNGVFYVTSKRKTTINEIYSNDIKKIIMGSRKLGFMFAKLSDEKLQLQLNIKF